MTQPAPDASIWTHLAPRDSANETLVANVHPADWQNPTPHRRYNLVVIGGGSAGLVAAAGAAGLGARVALVERHLLGGDCLNVGCVPSKALIRSARLMGELARADEFGVQVPEGVTVDFGAVMARVRGVRAGISHHDSAARFRDLGVDIFFGEGRFTGPDRLAIGGQTLRFANALIATGSRPRVLPIEGLAEAGFLTNETVWNLTERPARLAILGAGPIGCELAQAFRRLGSEVTVLDIAPQVLGREDEEAARFIEATLQREGVRLLLEARTQRVSQQGATKVLHYEKDGVSGQVEADAILLSVGRAPNVEGLGLEAAGVEVGKQGILVNDQLQSSNPRIFAAGDVALPYQFTHLADASARIVLRNALFPGPKQSWRDLVIPWCTYTDPEVAHVGLYPREAAEQGIPLDCYQVALPQTDRGAADGEPGGFLKIHTRQGSDEILGATLVAPHAGEMINEITLAMSQKLGLGAIAQVIHPYPTQAEAIKKAADAYNRTRLTPLVQKLFSFWMRWTR